jgi:hypothetical protein
MFNHPGRSANRETRGSRREFLKTGATAAAGLCFSQLRTSAAAEPDDGRPRKLTRGAPQIFVDLDALEKLDNVQQLLHSAEKHPANPVISPTRPWEREGGGPAASVIFDREEKIFKCWYQGVIGDKLGTTQYGPHTLNYATSTDGVHWDRPDLGLHEVCGTKNNNVVVPPEYHDGKDHWESVNKDPFDPDPKRRYKAFGWSSRTGGLHTAFSQDGLNWTHSPGIVVPGGDAQSMMIDTLKKRYVLFVRSGPRATYESTDFVHWSKPNESLPWPHGGNVYNHNGFVYGETYLGWVTWFHSDEQHPRFPRLELHLLTSRDGLHYSLVTPDAAVVPCGIIGDWDRWMTMLTGAPPARVGDKLHIYYRGFSRRHKPFGLKGGFNDTYEAGGVGLATIRLDGFASLAAGFDGGQVTTKPVIFEGSTLSINAKADAHARVVVEVLAETGQVIPGYSAEDCTAMTSDRVDHAVSWKANNDVGPLAGRPVRLRFHLTNARLYSYRIG